MKKWMLVVLILVAMVASVEARWYDVHLRRVVDGDTLVVVSNSSSKEFMCRMYGIDAPELHFKGKAQPYGLEAKTALEDSLKRYETFQIQTKPKDQYGRYVCRVVKVIDNIPYDFNWEMVRRGHAWAYKSYLTRPYASIYEKAEKQARQEGLGLWHDTNPTPPWEFRKAKK